MKRREKSSEISRENVGNSKEKSRDKGEKSGKKVEKLKLVRKLFMALSGLRTWDCWLSLSAEPASW